jgi:polyhydroxybutyrate depolymerase
MWSPNFAALNPGCGFNPSPVTAIGLIAAAIWVIAANAAHVRAAETSTRRLVVNGSERSLILSVSATGRPHPTVIVLHGGSLNAENARRSTGFEPLVDREGLAAIYPDAVAGHWNDGRSSPSGAWRNDAADDVGFIRALVRELVQSGIADARRIYVTGPSNGGMMTFRLVCDAADLFAAAAPVIASLPAELAGGCNPVRPIPILVMNGTADPLVPYGGGGVGFRGGRGRVLSTDETMTFLRKVNGCREGVKRDSLADADPHDGSSVTVASWSECSSGAPVILYKIEGGGHRIPRRNEGPRPVIDRLFGRANHDFEAAEAIWSFFRDKTR